MRYRKLSDDGDYVFGNGQMDFYRDVPDAPAQAVKTRLELWLGEWYLDIESGTPYIQGILGKYSKTDADVIIQDRVNNTQGIDGISEYESVLDVNTRAMSVRLKVNTVYGPTALQIQNYRIF